ncbi:hypothetical protein B0H17DRAFT_1212269 [Mycena rosella]|uniref:Uncharacterized protein n=1 Tax=Mycena rosella TaxID=1033263 RepID=A0AAD7CSU1_MYCRO|nr:hypothetical protein B0H17DRAFT_1212269 [Mycena rosella]
MNTALRALTGRIRILPAKAVALVLQRFQVSDEDTLRLLRYQGNAAIRTTLLLRLNLPPPVDARTQEALVSSLVRQLNLGTGFLAPVHTYPPRMFSAVAGAISRDRDDGLEVLDEWIGEHLGDVLAALEEAAEVLHQVSGPTDMEDIGIGAEGLADLDELRRRQYGLPYVKVQPDELRQLYAFDLSISDVTPVLTPGSVGKVRFGSAFEHVRTCRT